jgi:bifunctional non-homologous end joining protein LigD
VVRETMTPGRRAPKSDAGEALATYRAKRDPTKTPEPMGDDRARRRGTKPRFVVQEHHARALHWDFRLEHDGVLVSWALPKGVPEDPKTDRLAVRTEDHPLSYVSFEGEIPNGEYGAGKVAIWDSGSFVVEKWTASEVMVVLDGQRVKGRYVLFPTKGKNWMIHRMDPAPADVQPMPARIKPMLASLGTLPASNAGWAYEIKWDGVRAIAFVEGGRVRMLSRNEKDLRPSFPEFQEIGEALGSERCVLDGEIIVIGEKGVPEFGRLQHRLHLSGAAAIRKAAADSPASYVVFDLMFVNGHSIAHLAYDDRRAKLESLHLAGNSFTTAESFTDADGAELLQATRDVGLEGIVAKRRDAPYAEGKRSDAWIKIKNQRTQEVVIGGWTEGSGSRSGSIGALLLGIPDGKGLHFVGKVGTGFSAQDRRELMELLARIGTEKNPFSPPSGVSEPAPHHYVRPEHVGEVQFSEWTTARRLRHPTWRGLRLDKTPAEVVVEE